LAILIGANSRSKIEHERKLSKARLAKPVTFTREW